jgi:precorrin-6B methylase 2
MMAGMTETAPTREHERSSSTDRRAAAEALLANLPELHFWDGRPQVGGMNHPIGRRLIEEVERFEAPRIIETGAGVSTLLFCALEPRALTTIAPSAELLERTLSEARTRGIATEPLRFLCDRSETALPPLAAAGEEYDIAFIDGSHNWPSVFVDFCYLNMMLPENGTLVLDDIQLYSVDQLFNLLRRQPEYEYVALDSKVATFRKVTARKFLPEWNGQPYIAENTVRPPR